jgi:cytidine deaminase
MAKLRLDAATAGELCQRAESAALAAYAPYSKFRVGAAVLGSKGIHVGCNIENTSYGLTICAERVALAHAYAAGDRDLRAIAVACIDGDMSRGIEEFVPCGACRQWMVELAPHMEILIAGKDQSFSVEELMPTPFRIQPDR